MIRGFNGEYRWLSNFWPSPITMIAAYSDIHGDYGDGPAPVVTYPTVEHAYQAHKVGQRCMDDDVENHNLVLNARTPGEAKRIARRIGTIPTGWMENRINIMEAMVWMKFSQNEDLGMRLVALGDCTLMEENTWGDKFWGTVRGFGENHLGRILMRTRRLLTNAAMETRQAIRH
jgi:ribA/ribD-fused uncharacterized protein